MTETVESRVLALPPLRQTIASSRLSARKALAQNFLLDLNLTRKIARAAGPIDQGTTIEIGPGPGGLTRALLIEGAKSVVAVERDSRAIAALNELAGVAGGRLTIIEGDALRLKAADIGDAPRRLVANLPYNIATRLIIDWLRDRNAFESITVMVQKEVGLRLCAKAGEADYGRLSIITQWLAEPSLLFEVPASAFTPPPKVTSTLVRLAPRAEPLFPANRETLEKMTAAAFGQRRKMLRASLRGLGGEALLLAADIDPTARPETLDIEAFCRLSKIYTERG
ncbi:MAG: 16S rRNA (adenine(1518)-N(6)/adenine(1519)-N(6))-dimethyltransferase RsmA [Alphaproteobacteria bacterium]|nr:16S rRNA (adenine(1518)-N(6)/adenine(1519)-N(6))-dimethyltransferase RsmA [Alphaproteobacteria bacterium]